MTKRVVSSDQAPKAVGPYSQAIAANGFLFVSGQIPIDPATGQIVRCPIDEQVKLIIRNINSILESAGLSLKDIVKTTVFLKDLNNFDVINRVYSEIFTAEAPARSAVEVSRLPKDVDVEVEAIAALPSR